MPPPGGRPQDAPGPLKRRSRRRRRRKTTTAGSSSERRPSGQEEEEPPRRAAPPPPPLLWAGRGWEAPPPLALPASRRMMKSSLHAEEDDFVPELQRSIHPRERPDWEETLSAMARGADIPEISGELPLRTCGSTASMKVKNVKKSTNLGLMGCDSFHRLSFTKGHFPKMAECAHFHYENVDFGNIQE